MSKDEKINHRRIVDQSALMQNISVLSGANFIPIDTGPFLNGISLEQQGSLENSGLIINKLYNFKDFIKSYNRLSPASLSALIPYIQIWKVYEDETERFIPFNNFYPKSAIESITAAGSDRGFQANLVNLEFVSQGKDIATTFIYQVKMNIIFDSIQTLFNENSKYLELFNPPKKDISKRGDFDPKYYQIKLKFGWNFNKDLPADLNPQQLQTFADFSGSELFLNYVMHRITINEDGSVALQVEYIGALEAVARNSTKLSVLSSEKMEELDSKSQQIEEIIERIKQRDDLDVSFEEDGEDVECKITKREGGDDVGDKYAADKELLETLRKQTKTLESNNKEEFINAILKKIQQQYNGTFPQLKIRNDIYLQRNFIVSSYSSFNDQERLSEIEKSRNLISLSLNPDNVKFEWNVLKNSQEIQNFNIDNYLKELNGIQSSQQLARNASAYSPAGGTTSQASATPSTPIFYTIPFFTFGRLLKALDSLSGKSEDGQPKKESDFLILCSDCNIASFGDKNFIDAKDIANNPEYKIYVDNGLVIGDRLAALKNEINIINITQIPIAITTFTFWVNKHITSQNLSQMSLINFLNSAIMDLLNLAVKSTNEDYVPTQNIKFQFFFDKIELNDDDNFLTLIRENQGEKEIIKNPLKDTFINKQIKPSLSVKKNLIVFYSMPQHNIRKSNFTIDLEDGIPHFFYGQNKGIINKITFREESMPYVREANIQTQVDKKPWKAGVFLRGKYNVIIEMLGTVNFRIGTMIYISPSFPGVINYGDPIEYGIGGYFVIISIKTSIESGKYTTSLEANWVATGTGEHTDLSHLPYKLIKISKPLNELNLEVGGNTAASKRIVEQIQNNPTSQYEGIAGSGLATGPG